MTISPNPFPIKSSLSIPREIYSELGESGICS